MAITEKHRHELSNEVERVLGARHAETLMELLPPVGWADVATKHDLDTAVGSLRREMATKDDLHSLRRDMVGWLFAAMGDPDRGDRPDVQHRRRLTPLARPPPR